MVKKQIVLSLCLGLLLSSSLLSFGEKPQWDDEGNLIPPQENEIEQEEIIYEEEEPEIPEFSREDVNLIRKIVEREIEKKQFSEAYDALSQLHPAYYNEKEKRLDSLLRNLQEIESESSQQSNVIFGDDDLDEKTKRVVKRLYKEALFALAKDNYDLGKDLLIQTLYYHRRNFKAKETIKRVLGLDSGTYKVENMEAKYWRQSQTFFYGGNYEKSINVLETLSKFDQKNPDVYERLGSSYYMLSDYKKALDAWTTALFLRPGDKNIEHVIEETKEIIEEEKSLARKKRKKEKEEKKTESVTIETEESQLVGVFPTQTKAYAYAQKLREENLTALVEELDNGKWAVKVPKSEINKGAN